MALIDYLNREVTAFFEHHKFPIVLEKNPETNMTVLALATPNGWPFNIPCVIGDICHNLRSALDICYMGVVRSVEGENASKRTMPVESNAQGLEASLGHVFENETLAKVKQALVTGIKSHRDFGAGGNRMVAALNKLSNWQKHNLLVPLTGVTEMPQNMRLYSPSTGSEISLGGATIGNSIGNMFALSGTDVEFTYDGEPTFEIRFEVPELGGQHPIIPTLLDFREAVREAIETFCEVWPSDQNPTFDANPNS